MQLKELRSRGLRGCLTMLVVLAACSAPSGSGVGIKGVAADLVFGIPPLPEPAPPPNFTPVSEEPLGVVLTRAKSSTPAPQADTNTCPEAGPTDFPDQEATTDVPKAPRRGLYRWLISGNQKVPSYGNYEFPRFSQRAVAPQAQGVATEVFEFSTAEQEISFGSQTNVTQVFRVVQGDGIYLISVQRRVGDSTRTFAPVPPVLLLPLPVKLGAGRPDTPEGPQGEGKIANFTTTGVDPRTQEVLEHTGAVVKRQRVDACGEIVDSWFVDGTQQFTSSRGDSYNRNYDYGVATQLGGLIVFEHVDSPRNNPILVFDASIGTLEPAPLPG